MNGLDTRTRARLLEILLGLDLAYILISHELDFLTATADVIYTMEKARSGWIGSCMSTSTFTPTHSGATTMNYTSEVIYSKGTGWLVLNPLPGSGTLGPGEEKNFIVSFDTTGLTAGTYEAFIRFTDPNALYSPAEVRVSLAIMPQGKIQCGDIPLYTQNISSPAVMILLDLSGSMTWEMDLVKETDVRVGRQYFFVSAGSAIVDGARIDTRAIGPLAFTLIGGWEASYNYVYIGPQAHGTNESEGGNYVGGVQVSLATVPDTSLDLSWLVTYDDGDLAQSILGLAGSRRFGKYGELYGQLRYDLLSEVFSEVTVGARANVGPKLTLNGEYFYSVPVFDATSIYSVFAVDRFQQILLRADYVLSSKVTLYA